MPKTTTIDSMSHGAFAITADETGKKVFIENACPGDELEYEIYDERKNFNFAHLTKLIKESPLRAKDPKCKVHKICGSCQWQHIEYEEQLKLKKKNLLDQINESKMNLESVEIPDLMAMDNPWNFRNKVVYPVDTVKSTGRLVAGYFKRNSNELINIKYCPIQYDIFDQVIERVKELCSDNYIDKSFLRHILVRANSDKSQVLVSLIVRKKEINKRKEINLKTVLELVTKSFDEVLTTTLNYNDNSTNVILGNETEVVTGEGFIIEDFKGLRLKISTESFFQVNTHQFAKIIDLIQEHVKPGAKILDAYCGIGTISLSLAKVIPDLEIHGVESVEAAVENAIQNAKRNEIEANFTCAKMEDKIQDFAEENFDILIINPPRKGCTNKVLDTLGKIKSKKIVYVSCNPSTLCRDIKHLEAFGYKTSSLQPIDMFPHSFHFENLAVLTREG